MQIYYIFINKFPFQKAQIYYIVIHMSVSAITIYYILNVHVYFINHKFISLLISHFHSVIQIYYIAITNFLNCNKELKHFSNHRFITFYLTHVPFSNHIFIKCPIHCSHHRFFLVIFIPKGQWHNCLKYLFSWPVYQALVLHNVFPRIF